jgi:hypothetical protein
LPCDTLDLPGATARGYSNTPTANHPVSIILPRTPYRAYLHSRVSCGWHSPRRLANTHPACQDISLGSRRTKTLLSTCLDRLCLHFAANESVPTLRRIAVVAMLLPAEASHGVLVARQSQSGSSGNITTVTAVRDSLNMCTQLVADLAKGRCVHSDSYLRHIPIIPSAQIDPRTTRQP